MLVPKMEKLVNKIVLGDKRSVAKAISIIENNLQPEKLQLLDLLYKHTGKAKVIGITGPPGAGKSTLLSGLVEEIRKNNFTVGIIAVDPSSPYSGGAILGDRIRMQAHATDEGVFIRSMGSRGVLGGVAKTTKDTVKILDAMGKDVIIIETVGVGQSELEIINVADTTVVVLNPSAGDSIQTAKAGIMEIADIFVVNKADLPNSQKLIYELETLLETKNKLLSWQPKIVKTIATEKQGIAFLWENIQIHYEHIEKTGILRRKRENYFEKELNILLHELLQLEIDQYLKANTGHLENLIDQNKGKGPIQIAEKVFMKLISSYKNLKSN